MDWTDGKALIGTGSPFNPVKVNDEEFTVDQTNNAYIFPGVGLGLLAVKARHVSDAMFAAAARALGGMSEADAEGPANLLPPIRKLRDVASGIARAVALKARDQDLCDSFEDDALEGLVEDAMWSADYRSYTRNDA